MYELHRARDRGRKDLGWLSTRHSFSFAEYYNPVKMRFGKLRVLNDDVIAPDEGFPMHEHKDMEIVTIVTLGELTHEDSQGNREIIKAGEAQAMSAGTGIRHSEYNESYIDEAHFFQIWILPEKESMKPIYSHNTYQNGNNELKIFASGQGEGMHIYQDAKISIGTFTKEYVHAPKDGCYIMITEGSASINGEYLQERDAIGVVGEDEITITPNGRATVLAIDVPMD